jgi:hypothetical protein
LQDYLKELAVITFIGHKYGYNIADAGITSASLQRWTYSQLTGYDAIQWRQNYYVGLNNNYQTFVEYINSYIDGIKSIDIDFCNVHWYNGIKCSGGFNLASSTFMKACGKTAVICNEFGIRMNSVSLFDSTVNEIRSKVKYAVAYSGKNDPGKAINLTSEMLNGL